MKGRLLKEILLIVPLNKCNPKRSQFVLSLKEVEIHTNLFAHWNWNTGVPCKVRHGPPLKYYRVCAQVLICHRPSAVWGCSVFYSATNNLFCPARRTRWQMFLPLGIYLLGCNGCKGSANVGGNNNTGGGQSSQAEQKRHQSQLESVVLKGAVWSGHKSNI